MKIKDTTTATISDGNGQFSLTVQNSESTLVASFLGYRTHEVKITPTTDNIKITLEEDAQQLDRCGCRGLWYAEKIITHQLGRSGTGRRPETYARHECK